MTIEDVIDEYKDRSYSTLSEKKEIMKNYRRDLIAAGMSEEEADEEVDNLDETTWSTEEWKDYYGLDPDDLW